MSALPVVVQNRPGQSLYALVGQGGGGGGVGPVVSFSTINMPYGLSTIDNAIKYGLSNNSSTLNTFTALLSNGTQPLTVGLQQPGVTIGGPFACGNISLLEPANIYNAPIAVINSVGDSVNISSLTVSSLNGVVPSSGSSPVVVAKYYNPGSTQAVSTYPTFDDINDFAVDYTPTVNGTIAVNATISAFGDAGQPSTWYFIAVLTTPGGDITISSSEVQTYDPYVKKASMNVVGAYAVSAGTQYTVSLRGCSDTGSGDVWVQPSWNVIFYPT